MTIDRLQDQLSAGLAFDLYSNELVDDAPLYHYTSADGILGIVSLGLLLGSNFSFVNDSAEMEFGRGIARPIVGERFDAEGGIEGQVLRRALNVIDRAVGLHETYIFSMCAKSDVLSQWRGYGTGGRYAIGLKRRALMTDVPRTVIPFKVIYAPSAEASTKIEKFVNSIVTTLRTFSENLGSANNEELDSVAISIALRFHHLLPMFKHKGFAEEMEWRLVWTTFGGDDPIEFKAKQGELRPMIQLVGNGQSGNLPITDVWVGYSHHKERAEKATRMLLQRYGYAVPIHVTELTFVE